MLKHAVKRQCAVQRFEAAQWLALFKWQFLDENFQAPSAQDNNNQDEKCLN